MSGGSASLVAVGDELIAGMHPDLNSPELARALARLGVPVRGMRVVPDDETSIAAAVLSARAEARYVIVTGGLGPTLDDVTRHGVARAFGRELELDPAAVRSLERWYSARGIEMPETNLRQALLPEGARLVKNRVGTAPGFRVEDANGAVVVLPGPPAEMRVVFAEEVEPWLRTALGAEALVERRFHLFGLSESLFAEMAGAWMERGVVPLMGCSVKKGVLSISLRGARPEAIDARALEVRERFERWIFSEDEERIERVLGRALIAERVSVALAESCTGGLAASLLTRVPGISAVLGRAWVTYSNEAKVAELGVSPESLERHGAVSAVVAGEMALGAARTAGARLGLAITGIAGPDGGTPEKPLGLVWIGTAFDGAVETHERRLPPGERDWIRTLAARHALFLGLRRLQAGLVD